MNHAAAAAQVLVYEAIQNSLVGLHIRTLVLNQTRLIMWPGCGIWNVPPSDTFFSQYWAQEQKKSHWMAQAERPNWDT
jgi:hypothetical protein